MDDNDKASPSKPDDTKMPDAGPHARPELTNPEATPGTGMLPPIDPNDERKNVQPSS
jgi:hypothetical protein